MRALRFLIVLALLTTPAAAAVRIKDVASLRSDRQFQLLGYGLVVGLPGSGDTLRNVPYTEQSISAMLDHMGLNTRGFALRNRNVASVIVTAEIPAGIEAGQRLDVTVSAMGDATSLQGGTLLSTQMMTIDGQQVGAAQGAVTVDGFEAQGQAETVTQGVPTSGRIPNGAIIQVTPPHPSQEPRMVLELRNPDAATAIRIIDAINEFGRTVFHRPIAYERDNRSVGLQRPANVSQTRLMAMLGELLIEPDTAARVVIDSRTGTVVIGQDVQISTVAVTYGTLNVKISETPEVSQPAPFANGTTKVVPRTEIQTEQTGGKVAVLSGSSLRALVAGLNRLGVKPPGIIAILQAIKTAGALQAELIAQ
jgi:flagellar P-ring protein precursor FlgI